MRRWQELSIEIPPQAADALGSWLVENGAPGIIEEPANHRLRLRAHFSEERSAEVVRALGDFLAALDEFFPGSGAASVRTAMVAEEDWAENWKQHFATANVGRRLRVRPPWARAAADERLDIEILPAMAFGTGQHASTLGCLLAIEDVFERDEPHSPTLDVGTGSGILAIAAARLGAREVVAIDTDPIAVAAAADNVRRNGLADVVDVRLGSIEVVGGGFALIVANLYSGVLRTMFEAFRRHAFPQAWLLVSGLLDADVPGVRGAGAAAGWRCEAERTLDGWATLGFRRAD